MLSATKVHAIFLDCLFRDGEDTTDHIRAEGIIHDVGFHPQRLESHRSEIESALRELPDEFRESVGGGWSFLNACMDRHGNHWAEHPTMEELFQLGIGIGKAKYVLPRDVWIALPGGVPYVSVSV